MFCKNCGADIPEGSTFCGNCGMKVTVEPSQQEPINQQYQQPEADPQPQPKEPQQDTYQTYQQVPPQQPQYSQPVYNAQPVQQPADLPNPTLWIILNIVMIVIGCCCSISSIIAIVGLVFAIKANNLIKFTAMSQGNAVTTNVGNGVYMTEVQDEKTRARNM